MRRHFLTMLALGVLSSGAGAAPLVPVAGPVLSHVGNLVQNGSFEDYAVGNGPMTFWANGTASAPFLSPGSWTTSGSSSNYALWGGNSMSMVGAPVPDGFYELYFGNGYIGSMSQVPTYNPDGS